MKERSDCMIERRESDCVGVSSSIVAKIFFFWVLLVDCVGASKFNYGFVYIFAYLDAKKMK